MQHDLIRKIWCIKQIPLTPIIANCISKELSIHIKRRRRNLSLNTWIQVQPALSLIVPELEGAVRTARAEGTMNWMNRDIVDGPHVRYIVGWFVFLAVAFEGVRFAD
jgi:hypothetical protein